MRDNVSIAGATISLLMVFLPPQRLRRALVGIVSSKLNCAISQVDCLTNQSARFANYREFAPRGSQLNADPECFCACESPRSAPLSTLITPISFCLFKFMRIKVVAKLNVPSGFSRALQLCGDPELKHCLLFCYYFQSTSGELSGVI